MSIQQYFNTKKNNLVSFFSTISNLIAEVSVAMQLEIDNEYIVAKNRMKNAGSEAILNYCKQMKQREIEIHYNALSMIWEYLNPIYFQSDKKEDRYIETKPQILRKQNEPNAGVKWDLKDDQKDVKIKVDPYMKVDQIEENNEQVTGHITKLVRTSNIKMDALDTNPPTTASKSKTKGLQTISKNPRDLFNIQQSSQQAKKRTETELSKEQEPINLLNKKRNLSSNKTSYRQTYNRSKPKDLSNQRQAEQSEYPNPVPLTHSYTEAKFRSNPIQSNEKSYNYQNFRSNQKPLQSCEPNPFKSSLSSPKLNKYKQVISKQFEQNQSLCENLDKKIHEQAVAILNKVKPKRSPIRKKSMGSLPKANNFNDKSSNTFSILDISNQNPINLTRQGYLQRLKQQK